MPQLGDLAFCQHGKLGLITEIVKTRSGTVKCYRGGMMEKTGGRKLGNWESKEPHIVGSILLRDRK